MSSLSFAVLGSGSSGNSTLVALNGSDITQYILIDAGLSPRDTARRLGPLGIALDQISHILLTHLDRDHFYPSWAKAACKHDITLHAHQRQRSRLQETAVDYSRVELFAGDFALSSRTRVQCVPLAHDQLGTVGFVLEHDTMRMGLATDLGRVPAALYEMFADLHALAIESNYDRDMQLASARPQYLKRRIMGGRGHLSNDESLEAVLRIADHSALSHIALLHLSRQCNCPRLVTSLYASRASELMPRLTVSNQYCATPMLEVTPGRRHERPPRPREQLTLF